MLGQGYNRYRLCYSVLSLWGEPRKLEGAWQATVINPNSASRLIYINEEGRVLLKYSLAGDHTHIPCSLTLQGQEEAYDI